MVIMLIIFPIAVLCGFVIGIGQLINENKRKKQAVAMFNRNAEQIRQEQERIRLEVEKQAAEDIEEKTARYYEEIERLHFQKELYLRLYDVQHLDLHKNLDEQQLKKVIANEKAIASIDKRISALYEKIEQLEG